MDSTLTPEEIRRYSRHLVMPEVGTEGQAKLKASRVLMVGAGGLGSPVALYLAAAGVGKLGLVEFDQVEESNLQRQVLFGQSDLGRPKIEVALERLREINPLIELVAHSVRLDSTNAREILGGYDLVVDGSDNFPTRYLINDACVMAGIPDVYGSIFRFEGQASVFWPGKGPCYRCLYPSPPPPGSVPSCAEGGVLGILPGVIGGIQAFLDILVAECRLALCQALLEVRANHLVHALEDAHDFCHQSVSPGHRPGDLGLISGRSQGELRVIARLEGLEELQCDLDARALCHPGDLHTALANLAIARPGVLGSHS